MASPIMDKVGSGCTLSKIINLLLLSIFSITLSIIEFFTKNSSDTMSMVEFFIFFNSSNESLPIQIFVYWLITSNFTTPP